MDRITDAARLACRMANFGDRADIWRSLKAFAATFGFDHLTVLKADGSLPHRLAPSVVYIDAPHGFADDFDRRGLCKEHPLIVRAFERFAPFSASDAASCSTSVRPSACATVGRFRLPIAEHCEAL